jgi:glucose/mannose-6-phosphate isomerase
MNMNLDDKKSYEKLDGGMVADSIERLADQIAQAAKEAAKIKIPADYKKATEIVVSGMGGSNLGAHIIRSAFADRLKKPLSINHGYKLPAHVGKNTLLILSSYSGNTEEPLSIYGEAVKRKAKILGITCRGEKNKLQKLMENDRIPGYIFTDQNNPSCQPRLGTGYSIFGMLNLLSRAGALNIGKEETAALVDFLKKTGRKFITDSKTAANPAKKMAAELKGRIPVFVGADFTSGNMHVLRNQMNECSKQFACYLTLPDLNHYAMEGLVFPQKNAENMIFFFFDSELYLPRIQERSKLTKTIVKKNGIPAVSFRLKGANPLEQAFETLQFGAWLSFYLGILNEVDPSEIPFVDWFKNNLK